MRQQEANLDKRANEQPEWQYRLEASYSVPVDCLQSRIVYDCNRTLDVQLATNQSLIQRRWQIGEGPSQCKQMPARNWLSEREREKHTLYYDFIWASTKRLIRLIIWVIYYNARWS